MATNKLIEEGNDDYYFGQLSDILDAPPNQGPPVSATHMAGHIWMGSQDNADDHLLLEHLGITAVLNMAGTRTFDLRRSPYGKDSCVKDFLMIPAQDHDSYDIMQHFADAWAFVERAKQRQGRVLIHCNLGINRCGVITAACLMLLEKRNLLEVAKLVKMRRSVVLCNEGFRKQLIRFARVRRLLNPYVKESSNDLVNKRRSAKVIRTNSNGVAYEDYYVPSAPVSREASEERTYIDNDCTYESTNGYNNKLTNNSNIKSLSLNNNNLTNGSANKYKAMSSLSKNVQKGVLSNDLMERIYRYIQPGKTSAGPKKREIEYRKPLRSTCSVDSYDLNEADGSKFLHKSYRRSSLESETCDRKNFKRSTGSLDSYENDQISLSKEESVPTVTKARVARRYQRSNTSDGITPQQRPHSFCEGDTFSNHKTKDYESNLREYSYKHQPTSVKSPRYYNPASTALTALTSRISSLTTSYDVYNDDNNTKLMPSHNIKQDGGMKHSREHEKVKTAYEVYNMGSKINGSRNLQSNLDGKSLYVTPTSRSYEPIRSLEERSAYSSDTYVKPYRPVTLPVSKGPKTLSNYKLAVSTYYQTSRPFSYSAYQIRQATKAY